MSSRWQRPRNGALSTITTSPQLVLAFSLFRMYRSASNAGMDLPSSSSHPSSFDEGTGRTTPSLLDELDKVAPLRSFDVSPSLALSRIRELY